MKAMFTEARELERLRFRDQRQVVRAVRQGCAVDDPALAAAAVAQARHVEELARTWSWSRPSTWPSVLFSWSRSGPWVLAALLFFLLVRVDPLGIALACLAVGVFAYKVMRYALKARIRAEQAEEANRRLLREQADGPRRPRPRPVWATRSFGYGRRPLDWVPIPLRYLVPIWVVWFGVVFAVGLTVPPAIQVWFPLVSSSPGSRQSGVSESLSRLASVPPRWPGPVAATRSSLSGTRGESRSSCSSSWRSSG